jgi:hypothetical protein
LMLWRGDSCRFLPCSSLRNRSTCHTCRQFILGTNLCDSTGKRCIHSLSSLNAIHDVYPADIHTERSSLIALS